MKRSGNQIQISGVLLTMLAVIGAVAYYFLVKNRDDSSDYYAEEQVYETPVPQGGPENAIGPQLSPEREDLFRQLDGHMTTMCDLNNID